MYEFHLISQKVKYPKLTGRKIPVGN